MLLDDSPLFRGKLSWFLQDFYRHFNFSYIMKKRPKVEPVEFSLR